MVKGAAIERENKQKPQEVTVDCRPAILVLGATTKPKPDLDGFKAMVGSIVAS